MILVALLLSLLALDREEELRDTARRGDLEKATALLDAGVPEVDAKNRYGATASFSADKGKVSAKVRRFSNRRRLRHVSE